MKLHIQYLIILCSALVIGGCDSDDASDVANNITEDPQLNGSFVGPCSGSDILNLSYRQRMTFSGNTFTHERTYFETSDCSDAEAGGTVELTGEFVVDADGIESSDAGAIQLELTKALVTPNQTYLVNALNTVGFCGSNDYTLNQEKEITEGTDEFACPVRELPETLYGAYSVEDDRLYLNNGGLSQMSEDGQNRPTILDKNTVYIKE